MGATRCLVLDHGKVLAGLIKRIAPTVPVVPVGSPEDIHVLRVDALTEQAHANAAVFSGNSHARGPHSAAGVVGCSSRKDAAGGFCERIASEGGKAIAVSFDDADAGVARVAALGGLHILVNNAGISIDALLMRADPADFSRLLDINLKGAFHCSKAAARHLLKARADGRIINISSVVGEQGNAGQAMYAAAKAGVLGLTKSMARELASRGVTVNAITPSFIDTVTPGDTRNSGVSSDAPISPRPSRPRALMRDVSSSRCSN